MIPFSHRSALDNAFNTRSHRLTAAALVATAAALMIATTWLVSSLIGGTSLTAIVGPAANEAVYPDQGLRNRAAAPAAESYPDQGLRNRAAAPAAESYPDQGLRNIAGAPAESYPDQGLRNRAAAPAAESYPDQGLRNIAGAPANDNYVDFGQRHSPAGSER